MKIQYHSSVNDEKYVSAKPKEYLLEKQIKKEKDGIIYTLKGKSFDPISILDRVVSGLFAAILALCIVPLLFAEGRKYIRQLAKEAWRQMEKVEHYVNHINPPIKKPLIDMSAQICESSVGLKERLKDISSMQSACCLVKMTVNGIETLRQYIFENKDGFPLAKKAINQRIDFVKDDLAQIGLSENCDYNWAILAKIDNKKFYCTQYNFSSDNFGGSIADDQAVEFFELFKKQLKINEKIFDDTSGKFLKSSYYREINK
jgi:hypothetical protein